MLSAQTAIATIRRSITLGITVRMVLWILVLTAVVAGPFFRPQTDVWIAVVVLTAFWIFLLARSFRSARLGADFPELVAAGQFDAAESQIESSLRAFSLLRPAKLLALHQLAVLRHAQARYADAAALSSELLQHHGSRLRSLSGSTRLILAQSSLELNDLPTAGQALAELGQMPSLPLAESLNLVALQVDYQSRLGAWSAMMEGWMSRVAVAEVMPSTPAAMTQAMLALAAENIGRRDVAKWLADRAALLVDVQELVKHRPQLAQLWPSAGAAPADTENESV
ncbi:MAG TPA: hypothetical protein PLD59_11985 [Tepidisphaeraceae bacterium]|nr:hypothetical protein [Tepidisphaeraceae bacterium]